MHDLKTRQLAGLIVGVGCASLVHAAELAYECSALVEATKPVYERLTIEDELPGAAFVVSGNLARNDRSELVVSSFGELTSGPSGTVPPSAGQVTMYHNAKSGNRPNGRIDRWVPTTIVSEAEGITFPNRPTIADVDERRKPDVIVPGGYFFDGSLGNARGSITWWESRNNGKKWIRHDVVTNSPFSYHSVLFDDFNGDDINDIVSVGENAGSPSDPFDDVIELHLFAGDGNGNFSSAVTLATGGGSLLTAFDVNRDGRLDIVSPQFFGSVAGQPFIPVAARDADSASFVWFENMGDGNFVKHAIGIEQGPGFAIVPVANLLGDGVTRWIATNHTNQNVTFPPFSLYPEPTVYEFTPGEDVRQLWSVRELSSPGDFPVTGGIGQAALSFLSAGELNGDGRTDIAVSGDGARGVFWMEQLSDGNFVTRQLPDSEDYGQAGGPVIEDLNRSGTNEIIFSSFDQNAVSIWRR